jgi:hypothetical protein
VLRNKKLKYYTDKTLKTFLGVIDFDRVNCVITIDDEGLNDDNYSSSSSVRYNEPKRFRIEIIGSEKSFLFQVYNSTLLREWTQALYANWHASRSFNILNS